MLETERLIMRPLVEGDVDDIFAMRSDEEIMRFIREPQARDEFSFQPKRTHKPAWLPVVRLTNMKQELSKNTKTRAPTKLKTAPRI
jgi:RimJ/RimL family protein N-acetyltransferase